MWSFPQRRALHPVKAGSLPDPLAGLAYPLPPLIVSRARVCWCVGAHQHTTAYGNVPRVVTSTLPDLSQGLPNSCAQSPRPYRSTASVKNRFQSSITTSFPPLAS